MVSDQERSVIRAAITSLLKEHSSTEDVVKILKEKYQDAPETLAFAIFVLGKERPAQAAHQDVPRQTGKVWQRIYLNDDSHSFHDIVELPQSRADSRFFKGWSPRAGLSMFIKYLRASAEIKRNVLMAQVINEYRNFKLFRDPNVVDVYDAGWVKCDDGSVHPFVATQFLQGRTLAEWREEKGSDQPTLSQTAEIIRVIAATLHRLLTVCKQQAQLEADRRMASKSLPDFMHLDLKPDNVIVLDEVIATPAPCGKPSLQWFSSFVRRIGHQLWPHLRTMSNDEANVVHVRREVSDEASEHTQRKSGTPNASTLRLIDFGSAGFADTANARGTSFYMAPERLTYDDGDEPNPTWDIFSLGAMMYYLHFGNSPRSTYGVSKDEWREWMNTIDFGDHDVNLIFQKCVAFESECRYSSPALLEEDLYSWIHDYPLRHLEGREYTRLQREELLLKRCRKEDRESDQLQLGARASLANAFYAGLAMMSHPILIYSGIDSAAACNRVGAVLAVMAAISAMAFLSFSGWRINALRLFTPLLAFIAAIEVVALVFVPDSLFAPLDQQQSITVVKYGLLLVGMTNVFYAQNNGFDRLGNAIAWLFIAFSVVVHLTSETVVVQQHAPAILWASESILAISFAIQALKSANRMYATEQKSRFASQSQDSVSAD